MKITKSQLKRIIKEEVQKVLEDYAAEPEDTEAQGWQDWNSGKYSAPRIKCDECPYKRGWDKAEERFGGYLQEGEPGKEVMAAINDVPEAAETIAADVVGDVQKLVKPSGLDPELLLQAIAAMLKDAG